MKKFLFISLSILFMVGLFLFISYCTPEDKTPPTLGDATGDPTLDDVTGDPTLDDVTGDPEAETVTITVLFEDHVNSIIVGTETLTEDGTVDVPKGEAVDVDATFSEGYELDKWEQSADGTTWTDLTLTESKATFSADTQIRPVAKAIPKPEINIFKGEIEIASGYLGHNFGGFALSELPDEGKVEEIEITIKNVGEDALTLSEDISISGANEFTIVSQPSKTINKDGSVTFNIKLTMAKNNSTGEKEATVTIKSDCVSTPSFSFKVIAYVSATSEPRLDVTIGGSSVEDNVLVNAGSVEITINGNTKAIQGTPTQIPIKLKNVGTYALDISSATNSNTDDFEMSGDVTTSNIEPGNEVELTITAKLPIANPETTITISSDDPNQGTFYIKLKVTPKLTINYNYDMDTQQLPPIDLSQNYLKDAIAVGYTGLTAANAYFSYEDVVPNNDGAAYSPTELPYCDFNLADKTKTFKYQHNGIQIPLELADLTKTTTKKTVNFLSADSGTIIKLNYDITLPPDVTLTDNMGSRKWSDEVIYFVLTDRFHDGDSTNNSPDYYQQDAPDLVWGITDYNPQRGGDFKGLKAKIDAGYFCELGITALWITPPLKNNLHGYHGYWAASFFEVDPHLGTFKEYREMVAAAHSKGIKIIQDIVVNHIGPLFYYDSNWSGSYDHNLNNHETYEFSWDRRKDPRWFFDKEFTHSSGSGRYYYYPPVPLELQNFEWYNLKGGTSWDHDGSDGAPAVKTDFFDLKDLATYRDDVLDAFADIYKYWIKKTNIDGFRVDTVKHVEHVSWQKFCTNIRNWTSSNGKPNFIIFGEDYKNPAGAYTFAGTDGGTFDSVLSFPLQTQIENAALGENRTTTGFAGILNDMKDSDKYNQTPHPNGIDLNARQASINFYENHDAPRFRFNPEGPGAYETQARNAIMFLLTWEGIPCLYYGAEFEYNQNAAGSIHNDEANRPFLDNPYSNTTDYNWGNVNTSDTFKLIKGLNELRQDLPGLRSHSTRIAWDNPGTDPDRQDHGILAYERGDGDDERILVIINFYHEPKAPSTGPGNDVKVSWPVGTVLEKIEIPHYTHDSSFYEGTDPNNFIDEITVDEHGAIWTMVPGHGIRIYRKK